MSRSSSRFVSAYDGYCESALVFPENEPSLTKQADAADADINVILNRMSGGIIPNGNPVQGMYDDFTDVFDYRESLEAVRQAEQMFMELPSKVRSRFQNDPQAFFDFVSDSANKGEMARMGLLSQEAMVAYDLEQSQSQAAESGAEGVP